MTDDSRTAEQMRAGTMALFAAVKDDEIKATLLEWYGVGSFFRVNEDWVLVTDSDIDGAEMVYINPEKAIEFIDKWDVSDSELSSEINQYAATNDQQIKLFPAMGKVLGEQPVTAAVRSGGCPPATQDIMINLENRNKAIKSVGYGPLNPDRPNVDFWEEKAKLWQTTADEAKTSRCANCSMFIRTEEMLECIEGALSNEQGEDAWGSVNAGDLGYCEAFDFKCAAGRTCDAWVAGGPVTGKEDK
jgi:hypothetical protein